MKVKDVWAVISTDNDLDVVDIETGELYVLTDAVNGNRNLCTCSSEYDIDKVLNAEVVKLEVDRYKGAGLIAWVDLYAVIYG